MVVEIHMGSRGPQKIKIYILSMEMDKNILTWANGLKRGWCSPNSVLSINQILNRYNICLLNVLLLLKFLSRLKNN
jgi:hypothetical protein